MISIDKPIFIFFLSYIFGLIFLYISIVFGESWEVFGDAIHYVSLYNGELAPAPWGYRIMTPFLAQLLPWDMTTNFKFITLNSLALITSILALYGKRVGLSFKEILQALILMGSCFLQ